MGNKINYDWPKKILAFNSVEDAAECAARVYFTIAQSNPESSIILPTDRSATLIFTAMKQIAKEYEGCPFGEAHIMSDTETFGVWDKHPASRTRHINEKLIEPLREIGKAPKKDKINLLSGIFTDIDPLSNARITVRDFPPSIHAISISPRGEILAYDVDIYEEANEIIDDPPRILQIGDIGKNYIDDSQPSNSIISIGLGTTLSSKLLIILVFESQKAEILHTIFTSSMTAKIPATLLQYHQNAFILTTRSIAHRANMDDVVDYANNPKDMALNIVSSHYVVNEQICISKDENEVDKKIISEKINTVFNEFIEQAKSERKDCEDYLKRNSNDSFVYQHRDAERTVWNTLINKLNKMNVEVLESIQNMTLEKLQKYLSNIREKLLSLSTTSEKKIERLRSVKKTERLNDVTYSIIQYIEAYVLEV